MVLQAAQPRRQFLASLPRNCRRDEIVIGPQTKLPLERRLITMVLGRASRWRLPRRGEPAGTVDQRKGCDPAGAEASESVGPS